ncbi:DUF2398 family protein [Streptomyces hilarionis]|uniref:DUF2398 family protein n=1 Tax=Streptomyces hilarionis TaxID=2839954 RepID=UPI002119C647|nr:DUF2398 family protein [Streptomyces hilarionis]
MEPDGVPLPGLGEDPRADGVRHRNGLCRTAARLLLAHPLVTSTGPHSDTFSLIRRHADWLVQRFQQVFGYRLLVEASYARLFKAGLGPGSGHRLEDHRHRAGGRAADPRGHTPSTRRLGRSWTHRSARRCPSSWLDRSPAPPPRSACRI